MLNFKLKRTADGRSAFFEIYNNVSFKNYTFAFYFK